MREKPFLFGEHKSLLGIVTEPAGDPDAARPAFIILNAGIVHRVGPHRKSVKLARRLAAAGFLAMRFDQSGIGDSEPRRDALSFSEGAVDDIRQAIEHLEATRGVDRFVLMGLCSGADNSYQTAVRDPRVVGITLIDGYAYKTPGYYVRYYSRRMRKLESWKNLARRSIDRFEDKLRGYLARDARRESAPSVEDHEMPVDPYVREFPPREEVAAGLRALVDRGVEIHIVFSSGIERYYNYEDQYRESFHDVDFKGHLTLKYFADTNHTFTELRSQEALIQAVVDWAATRLTPRRAA